jgi:hypothetical protein
MAGHDAVGRPLRYARASARALLHHGTGHSTIIVTDTASRAPLGQPMGLGCACPRA